MHAHLTVTRILSTQSADHEWELVGEDAVMAQTTQSKRTTLDKIDRTSASGPAPFDVLCPNLNHGQCDVIATVSIINIIMVIRWRVITNIILLAVAVVSALLPRSNVSHTCQPPDIGGGAAGDYD